MAPTGSKDPFALRRAANAIVKILAESELPLTLSDVLCRCGCTINVPPTGSGETRIGRDEFDSMS